MSTNCLVCSLGSPGLGMEWELGQGCPASPLRASGCRFMRRRTSISLTHPHRVSPRAATSRHLGINGAYRILRVITTKYVYVCFPSTSQRVAAPCSGTCRCLR